MTSFHFHNHGLLYLALSPGGQAGARVRGAKPASGPCCIHEPEAVFSSTPLSLLAMEWTSVAGQELCLLHLWHLRAACPHVDGAAELLTTPTLPHHGWWEHHSQHYHSSYIFGL